MTVINLFILSIISISSLIAFNLLGLFKNKSFTVLSKGYDIFKACGLFYNDIYKSFTIEVGKDVLY